MKILLGLLALWFAAASWGEPDLSQLAEDDLEKMSEEERNALPAKEVFLKFVEEIGPAQYDHLVRGALYARMYMFEYSPPLDGLIREYQQDIGVEPTGWLTLGEATRLFEDDYFPLPTPVYASGSGKPYIVGGVASAQGTWVILGDDIAMPVNTSDIRCYRSRDMCFEFIVQLKTHEVQEGDGRVPSSPYYLYTDIETWEIIHWGEEEIVARGGGECRRTTMTMNSRSEEVTQVTRNAGGSCDLGLASLPPLEQPRVAVLKDGFDVTYAYFKELQEATRQGWSSRYRELLGSMQQKTSTPR